MRRSCRVRSGETPCRAGSVVAKTCRPTRHLRRAPGNTAARWLVGAICPNSLPQTDLWEPTDDSKNDAAVFSFPHQASTTEGRAKGLLHRWLCLISIPPIRLARLERIVGIRFQLQCRVGESETNAGRKPLVGTTSTPRRLLRRSAGESLRSGLPANIKAIVMQGEPTVILIARWQS